MSDVRPAACPICEIHAESTFCVEGMDCQDEVALIGRRLKHLQGFESFSADVFGGRLHVQYDAARLTAGHITAAVADTGMRAWLEHEQPVRSGAGGWRVVLLVVSALALTGAMAAAYAGSVGLARVLALAAVATGAAYPASRAWTAVTLGTVDMNVLMTIAVAGAVVIGQWTEAAAVSCLFALAQHLEARSMDRARHAIRALMDLTPPEATVLRSGVETVVPVSDIGLGERLRIRPGARIPLDGRVAGGASDVNQAPITGESLPVDKRAGDEVFAGTINGRGALEVTVTRRVRDTTLARIIHLVESAEAKRAPVQSFVDRFARRYTPAVIAFAAFVAVVPPLAGWGPAGLWFYRALVLLVIACPCALVIATPVAVVSALAALARRGVLVKGGLHLETLARVGGVAFDKTGTITRGVPSVAAVVPCGAESADTVLGLAAAVDRQSEHPLAAAIVRRAREAGIPLPAAEAFQSRPGRGAGGVVARQEVLVGGRRLMEEAGIAVDSAAAAVAEHTACGRSVVFVSRAGTLVGIIALADTPRETAHEIVELLRQAGIPHVAMLTGDGAAAAESIARAAGIEYVRAGLLPEDKVEAVTALKARWGRIAMVGDGVNDAPALAAADVGIAMGAAGSDVALETADIALMGDALANLPVAVRVSRAAMATIHVNVAAALGVKALVLALAVLGHASLWMAIVADTGTSLLVIANGLRLLRAIPPPSPATGTPARP